MSVRRFAWWFALCAALVSVSTHAADKALLIGVSEYPGINDTLPGIELDLKTMQRVAKRLGYEDGNIRVLIDDDVTPESIEREIKGWLSEGVNKNDRVLFYFSGHGSQIPDQSGDETDGVDEVLLTYETRREALSSGATLVGVIKDDNLNDWLKTIPSRRITVIVDACHSGTVTRSFGAKRQRLGESVLYSKAYTYEGKPSAKGLEFGNIVRDAVREQVETRVEARASEALDTVTGNAGVSSAVVSLAAARDDQEALASAQGSVFTLAVGGIVEDAASTGETISLEDVRERADASIAEVVDPEIVHNPVLAGDTNRVNELINIQPNMDGYGPTWNEVVLVAESGDGLHIKTRSQTLDVGEELEVGVEIPVDGYLNIISVDSEDNAAVLFPNQHHSDNRIRAGELSFPTERMKFEIKAQEPAGPTLFAAFVTEEPLDLYAMGIDGRDDSGVIRSVFTNLSSQAEKALQVFAIEDDEGSQSTVLYSSYEVFSVQKRQSKGLITRSEVNSNFRALRPKSTDSGFSIKFVGQDDFASANPGDLVAFEIASSTAGHLIFVHVDSHGNATAIRSELQFDGDRGFSARIPEEGKITIGRPLGTDTVFAIRTREPIAERWMPKEGVAVLSREEIFKRGLDVQVELKELSGGYSIASTRYQVSDPSVTTFATSKAVIREFRRANSAQAPIEFEHDSSDLTDKSRAELDLFGDSLVEGPYRNVNVTMIGHTDSTGDENYNKDLGGTRAEGALGYLKEKFNLPSERFVLESRGEREPVADNSTEEGRAKNRRVQFVIQ